MSRFGALHPLTALVYWLSVLLISMLTLNPVIVTVCWASSVLFGIGVLGFLPMLKSLAYSVPMAIMIALLNPMFVHRGETVLFFLNDNPVTGEAILYGVFASLMLMSVFYWCKAYSEIMTSDKVIYLFGGVLPKTGLAMSMSMMLVPKLKRKYREIDQAQRALGIYSGKSYVDKIRSKLRVFSVLITVSLEDSIETADSMRARGYGLKKRTHCSLFRFTCSDLFLMAWTLMLTVGILILTGNGAAAFSYYPTLSKPELSFRDFAVYAALILLTGTSAFMEAKEKIVWRYLRSGT